MFRLRGKRSTWPSATADRNTTVTNQLGFSVLLGVLALAQLLRAVHEEYLSERIPRICIDHMPSVGSPVQNITLLQVEEKRTSHL